MVLHDSPVSTSDPLRRTHPGGSKVLEDAAMERGEDLPHTSETTVAGSP